MEDLLNKETCFYFFTNQINKNFTIKGGIIKFITNKEKGNTGLGRVIAYYTLSDYDLSKKKYV